MPTGAKLVGAVVFAALAYFVSDLVKPLMEQGARPTWFSPVNAAVGLIMGWKIMGRGAGQSYRRSFGFGLTTIAVIFFWCIVIWAGYKMVLNSMKLSYGGPVEALQDMAQISIDYARMVAIPEVLIPAAIGAIFMGWLTEFFARRWS